MRRCLDTTFISRLLRGGAPERALLRSWADAGDELSTTEVNFFEAALGVETTRGRAARAALGAAWREFLLAVDVLPLTRRATLEAVRRQAALYAEGSAAPVPDLLVAAIAKVGGCGVVVTRNARDFERIALVPVEAH